MSKDTNLEEFLKGIPLRIGKYTLSFLKEPHVLTGTIAIHRSPCSRRSPGALKLKAPAQRMAATTVAYRQAIKRGSVWDF